VIVTKIDSCPSASIFRKILADKYKRHLAYNCNEMDRSIIFSLLLLWAIISILFVNCKPLDSEEKVYTWTISDLKKEHKFSIPYSCEGWYSSSERVVKNTANDSIFICGKYFKAGQIGRTYTSDIYGDGKNITYHYWPYKATSGEIVVKIHLSGCQQNK
jgi:hypothetical protein